VNRTFFVDLLERVLFTAGEAYAGAVALLPPSAQHTRLSLKIGGAAAGWAALKCLLASRVGSSSSASAAPTVGAETRQVLVPIEAMGETIRQLLPPSQAAFVGKLDERLAEIEAIVASWEEPAPADPVTTNPQVGATTQPPPASVPAPLGPAQTAPGP